MIHHADHGCHYTCRPAPRSRVRPSSGDAQRDARTLDQVITSEVKIGNPRTISPLPPRGPDGRTPCHVIGSSGGRSGVVYVVMQCRRPRGEMLHMPGPKVPTAEAVDESTSVPPPRIPPPF